MKANGEISEGTRRTKFAQMLADRMEGAYKTNNSSASPVGWRHINNMLPAWGLWPIKLIK
jgi:hypothetical protein